MKRIRSRNLPCPCGSGRRRKHCCPAGPSLAEMHPDCELCALASRGDLETYEVPMEGGPSFFVTVLPSTKH